MFESDNIFAQDMQERHERYYRHDCGLAWNRTRGRYNQMNNMMSVFGLNEETFYQSHKKWPALLHPPSTAYE